MPRQAWIVIALAVVGCAGSKDAQLTRRAENLQPYSTSVAATTRPVDTDAASFESGIAKELAAVADVERLRSALSDQSVDTLARAINVLDQRRAIHVDNLANAQTVGFKRCRVIQTDLQTITPSLDFTQGDFEQTGRQLDLAINGNGFFHVRTAGGDDALTRCGNLFVNDQHLLVVGSRVGPRLVPETSVPPNVIDLNIAQDGTIEALMAGAVTPVPLGQIELATVRDPAALAKSSSNLFSPTAESGDAIYGRAHQPGFGSIEQGELESSNVDETVEQLAMLRVARERALIDSMITNASR